MGPGYFIIAIMGCADGGSACTQVATLQTRYTTSAACSAATTEALEANSNFDFPTLVARCQPGAAAMTAEAPREQAIPASARRG